MRIISGVPRRTLAVLAISLSLGSLPAFSQNSLGSIVGTVTDGSGAAVAGATVTLTNDATGQRRSSTTDASGNYQFVSLTPENYKLDIEGTGFKHYSRDPLTVQ